MKHTLLVCLLGYAFTAAAQRDTVIETGTASYVSSQNVYVKFESTEYINRGDTLFLSKDGNWQPALWVKDKSSTSCVCGSLLPEKVKVGDAFFARTLVDKKREKEKAKPAKTGRPLPSIQRDSTVQTAPGTVIPPSEDKDEPQFKQKVRGRISAASYSSFSGAEDSHRLRYTLTYQGNNLKNSRFSTDNYISFRHTVGEWQEVRDHFNDALKIYSLSVKYDFDKQSSITLGRKINQRISSMGAIDGLQVEKGWNRFFAGAIAGSRPDFRDYRFNVNLLQAGAYLGYGSRKKNKFQESTLAFVEQRNHASIDRRFVYFQHSNTLWNNLSLFASFEIDLYQLVDSVASNRPSLTNLLLTARYKASKNLSLSLSYDNRKNIIYYESYKSFIEQLIENETRQGLRLGINYRLTKTVTLGTNFSWRFQKSDPNLSKNLNAYLNFNRVPWLKTPISLSANLLSTPYVDSKMYGVRFTREIVRGKWNVELYGRWVNYNYKNYENRIEQKIAGASLSWNITRKLGFYIYYEGTYDKHNEPFNRFNTRLIQRF